MTVRLERINEAIQFRGSNGSYDVTVASSKEQTGISPMEMVAMSVGGCSSIDILLILDKQKQAVEDFAVDVEAERADGPPAVFTDLHVHYTLTGDVDPDKVRRAIDLSLKTYCSVSKMIEKTAAITYAFTVNGARYE